MKGVAVSIFDAQNGEMKYTTTNSFGYYSFGEVEVSKLYVLRVMPGKRYTIINGFRSFTAYDNFVADDFIVER